MKEINPKDAIDRLEANPLMDKEMVKGLKDIVYKQATIFPDKPHIIQFFDVDGVIQVKMNEHFKRLFNKLEKKNKPKEK